MAITFSVNSGNAVAAAQAFAQQLQNLNSTVQALSQGVSKFDSNGKLISQTFQAITSDGQKVELVLRQIGQNFELVSAKVNQAAQSLKAFQSAAPSGGDKSGSSLISGFGVLRLIEAQVIKRITGAVQSSLAESLPAAQEFSIKIAEIGTISQRSGVSIDQFSTQIRALSAQFGATQADVAEGAYQALSNQVTKGADTFDFLTTALRFGKAAVASTADSVNLLSSAMKSFNIPTSEAEKVASVLFKTIELGRVRASDMANTFGRIGTVAADVGVKLEETAAAVAVLTTRGVKFNDASTLIQNVLLKLLRPTEEMSKFLNDLGFASGEAAVKALGFGGVLQKLDQEAQKGTSRLGELFNQVRALRGVIGLTGGAFTDFNSALAEIQNGASDFNNAVKIVEASFGDRFKVQINEAKVAFTQLFGDTVLAGIVQFGEKFGGLGNVVKTTSSVLLPLGAALAGFKVTTLAISAATAVWTTVTGAQAVALGAQAAATTAATTATGAYATALGYATVAARTFIAALPAFGAGYALGSILFFEDGKKKAQEYREELEKLAKVRFDDINKFNKQVGEQTDRLTIVGGNTETFKKILLQNQAAVQRSLNQTRDKATEALQAINEKTKEAATAFFAAANQRLGDLKRIASQAREEIKRSLENIQNIPQKLNQQIFDFRSKFANEGRIDVGTGAIVDDQKSQLIRQRINQLTDLARQKAREGTTESLAESRKYYDEIEKLELEFGDLRIKNQRRVFEEQVRRGQVAPTATEIDPVTGQLKQRFEFQAQTAETERALKAIAEERLALEQRIKAEKEEQLKATEAQIAKEQAKLKTVKEALDAASKISLLDKEGNLKSEFRGTSTVDGKQVSNLDRGVREFERQQQRAREALRDATIADQAALDALLKSQAEAFYKQVAAIRAAEEQKANTQSLTKTIEFFEAQTKAAKEASEKAGKALGEALSKAFVAAGTPQGGQTSKDQIEQFVQRFANKFTADGSGKAFGDQAVKVQKLKDEYTELAKAFNAAGGALKNDASTENLAEFNRKGAELVLKLKEIAAAASGVRFDELSASARRPVEELEASIRATNSAVTGVADAAKKVDEIAQAYIRFRDAAIRATDANPLLKLSQSAPAAEAAVTLTLTNMTSEMQKLLDKTNETATAIANLGKVEIPDGASSPVNLPEEEYFGGPTKRHFGTGGFPGPRGSDNILAYLNKREFVANAQATDNWAPLLQAMNSGLRPNDLSQNSVTNVGDININVSGGNNSQQSLRNIATGLRRGLRRKTISLS